MSTLGEPIAGLPVHVIPVIDVKDGRAVHAIGGRRNHYAPLATPLVPDSDPLAIASELSHRVGHRQLYVADLDALEGARPAWSIHQRLLAAGCELWLDVGLTSARQAEAVAELLGQGKGVQQAIAALETLPDLNTLADILQEVGTARLVFSLDLRNGELMTTRPAFQRPPLTIVGDIVRLGIERMIVLDVGGVGRCEGPTTLALCRQIRSLAPHIELVTGGGVRGIEDLREIRDAGCDAALVSTWLHTSPGE